MTGVQTCALPIWPLLAISPALSENDIYSLFHVSLPFLCSLTLLSVPIRCTSSSKDDPPSAFRLSFPHEPSYSFTCPMMHQRSYGATTRPFHFPVTLFSRLFSFLFLPPPPPPLSQSVSFLHTSPSLARRPRRRPAFLHPRLPLLTPRFSIFLSTSTSKSV